MKYGREFNPYCHLNQVTGEDHQNHIEWFSKESFGYLELVRRGEIFLQTMVLGDPVTTASIDGRQKGFGENFGTLLKMKLTTKTILLMDQMSKLIRTHAG